MERNKNLNGRAQALRRNMTKEEEKLWYRFLCRYSPPFRRQYIIGNYITDFYCHEAALVVELDGSQHYNSEQILYDSRRTAYLESLDLQVLRFSNFDVLYRFRDVCTMIDQVVKARTTQKQ